MRLEYYVNISAALFEHHLVGRARPRPLEGLLAREALVVRDERAGVDPCGGFDAPSRLVCAARVGQDYVYRRPG